MGKTTDRWLEFWKTPPRMLPYRRCNQPRATLAPPGGDLVATLQGHERKVYAVAITPDGALGVSGSADGTIRIWDLDRQVERFVMPVGHGEVRSVAIARWPIDRLRLGGRQHRRLGRRERRTDPPLAGGGRWRTLVMTPDGTADLGKVPVRQWYGTFDRPAHHDDPPVEQRDDRNRDIGRTPDAPS